MPSHFTFTAVGIVHSPIREPLDDVWGGVTSRIELDSSRFAPDCLKGLDEFSHGDCFHLPPHTRFRSLFWCAPATGAGGLARSGHFRSAREESAQPDWSHGVPLALG